MTNAHDNQTNNDVDAKRGVFTKLVKQLGRETAEGRDALPKLAIAVCRAANEGVISVAKGSTDIEDAYGAYASEDSKKQIHERTADGKKANISKLRQIGILGANPKIDGVQVLTDTIEVRKEMEGAGEKIKSAYASYVDVARAQNGQDDVLTKGQLQETIRKGTPETPELNKVLEKLEKQIEGLITGENKAGHKISDAHVDNMIDARGRIREVLAALESAEVIATMHLNAAKLGLTIGTQPAPDAYAS